MAPGEPRPFGAFGFRLQFEGDGFVYAGQKYLYTSVKSVEFKRQTFILTRQHSQQRVFDSKLRVTFHTGKRLNIYVNRKLGKYQRSPDRGVRDSMAAAAEWLQAYTFNGRMDRYEAEFAAKKFTTWGKYQIAANGDLFRRYAFCFNLRDEQVRCLLYDFHLTCLRRPKAWWKRILLGFMKNGETLDLSVDRDCFLYFMRKHLKMFWTDEPLRLYRGAAAEGTASGGSDGGSQFEGRQGGGERRQDTRQERPHGRQESGEREAPPPPPPSKPMPSYPQHLATLGLGPDAEWDVVRATYRKLAREHHPDLVRGRGANEAAVKVAEEKLKVFNEAYGWLEDFYKLKPR